MINHIETILDEKFKTLKLLNWLPFIGKDYFTQKNKILIIGESHYVPKGESTECYNDINWTRHFILKEGLQLYPWFKGETKNNLIREVEKTINNKIDNEFWNQVTFFNLIQRLLESKEKNNRPTYEDIKNGLYFFKSIVDFLNPDTIVFCGLEASKHFVNLLNDNEFKIEELNFPKEKINNSYPKSFQVIYNGKKCSCFFIKHPSSFYSSELWREFIFKK